MGDVILFPTNRAAGRAHAAQLEEALIKAPRLRYADQRRFAENLWVILKQASEQGKRPTVAEILHASGQGGEGDSTKRLRKWAMDPKWPDEKKNKRPLTKGFLAVCCG
jgi:hypothetical protein